MGIVIERYQAIKIISGCKLFFSYFHHLYITLMNMNIKRYTHSKLHCLEPHKIGNSCIVNVICKMLKVSHYKFLNLNKCIHANEILYVIFLILVSNYTDMTFLRHFLEHNNNNWRHFKPTNQINYQLHQICMKICNHIFFVLALKNWYYKRLHFSLIRISISYRNI